MDDRLICNSRWRRRNCAACKYNRRKCEVGCLFAPYFPVEKTREFLAVLRVFGMNNVKKMILGVDEANRRLLVESLVRDAFMREMDPVLGVYGEYTRAFNELLYYKALVHTNLVRTPIVRLWDDNYGNGNDRVLVRSNQVEPYYVNCPMPNLGGAGALEVTANEIYNNNPMASVRGDRTCPIHGITYNTNMQNHVGIMNVDQEREVMSNHVEPYYVNCPMPNLDGAGAIEVMANETYNNNLMASVRESQNCTIHGITYNRNMQNHVRIMNVDQEREVTSNYIEPYHVNCPVTNLGGAGAIEVMANETYNINPMASARGSQSCTVHGITYNSNMQNHVRIMNVDQEREVTSNHIEPYHVNCPVANLGGAGAIEVMANETYNINPMASARGSQSCTIHGITNNIIMQNHVRIMNVDQEREMGSSSATLPQNQPEFH